MAAQNDIRIGFELDDRRYEAVGFLREGESSVIGDEMLRRTAGENDGAIGDEDEAFLREHLQELPGELQRYYLATGKRNPGYQQYVSYFNFDGDGWCQGWSWLGYQWHGLCLVVRRCA